MGVIGEPLGEGIKADQGQGQRRQAEAERVEQEAGADQAGAGEQAQGNGAGQGNPAGGQVPPGGARVERVVFAVRNAIERHGAGAGADQGGKDEAEFSPPGPTPVVPRCNGHRGQPERERKGGVREFHEISPFAQGAKHRIRSFTPFPRPI